jgi:hypothetical protein
LEEDLLSFLKGSFGLFQGIFLPFKQDHLLLSRGSFHLSRGSFHLARRIILPSLLDHFTFPSGSFHLFRGSVYLFRGIILIGSFIDEICSFIPSTMPTATTTTVMLIIFNELDISTPENA